jgi:hypothetical protein
MDSATRCPLCGNANDCGAAAGKGDCWCWSAVIPDEAIARVPEDLRGKICVCQRCAQAAPLEAGARQRSSSLPQEETD